MGLKRSGTDTSNGLSATLIGHENHSDSQSPNGENIDIRFFFDDSAVLYMNGVQLDEARGHRTLLVATEYDLSLRRSALLEGSTIDFLFENKKRAAAVKRYIRCLHEEQQDVVAALYCDFYKSIIEYHVTLQSYGFCSCCKENNARSKLEEDLGSAFDKFERDLICKRNVGLVDDI